MKRTYCDVCDKELASPREMFEYNKKKPIHITIYHLPKDLCETCLADVLVDATAYLRGRDKS
jgi:hypothetical protein